MRARTFHHSAFSAERIAAERAQRGTGVAVCLPARECAGTVGEIVTVLSRLREAGAIDRIVVVDAASRDGTADVAERAGAEVWQEGELLPSFGAVLGKGDAMWRACSRLDSDLVCFLDADTERFCEHFATGLLGPLVCEPGVEFVKAFYRRPLRAGGGSVASAQRAPVERLDEVHAGLAHERTEQARREVLGEALGVGVEEAHEIAVQARASAPHRVALA
jgi:hypothetical protein